MVEYNKVNVKLWDTQLKKLKNPVKNKTGATWRINLKMFNGNLNMLIPAYNLITKRITRSLYVMLEKPNKDNKYLVKY